MSSISRVMLRPLTYTIAARAFCASTGGAPQNTGRPHHLDSSTTIVPGQERAPASTATLKTVGNSYIGLGKFDGIGDDPIRLAQAIAYLEGAIEAAGNDNSTEAFQLNRSVNL
ncbi:hypothetical protein Pmar_PMAR019246 [Perkinsus marinus ATCC 50983]|uniref:Uncharacterized protein n=1 Tax=Perkinsus marinus (strain ATCC 50983 / TXsc) TaxID=423536 RepID=C5KU97_PERM5|nr:hypothetical protein Pmar_PMAR019246 [Perkinsus marinus ATCC 50983]EER12139.1 hypothetical protein Pmar_PMAR019246 [Perkinsus marinus ATCC 50983]|eukprot:XP_002780344.1 hypothetical protein Pmar_PMAR019246 [Perkinsus marinus ATCC 50983]